MKYFHIFNQILIIHVMQFYMRLNWSLFYLIHVLGMCIKNSFTKLYGYSILIPFPTPSFIPTNNHIYWGLKILLCVYMLYYFKVKDFNVHNFNLFNRYTFVCANVYLPNLLSLDWLLHTNLLDEYLVFHICTYILCTCMF